MKTCFDEPDPIEHLDFHPQCGFVPAWNIRCERPAERYVKLTTDHPSSPGRLMCEKHVTVLERQSRVAAKGVRV